jgi:hypothetical protein
VQHITGQQASTADAVLLLLLLLPMLLCALNECCQYRAYCCHRCHKACRTGHDMHRQRSVSDHIGNNSAEDSMHWQKSMYPSTEVQLQP